MEKHSTFLVLAGLLAIGFICLKNSKERTSSENRIRTIINHMNAGLVILTEEGKFETANPSFESLSGYWASELVGKHISTLVSSTKEEGELAKSLWSRKDGTVYKSQIISKDGRDIPVEISTKQLKVANGKRLILDVRSMEAERMIL